MFRSNTQNRFNSSKRKSTKRRLGIESMEGRRLMAGDVALAIGVDTGSGEPTAILAEDATPMPQTREHILLARQVGVPHAADAGANPMDLKRGIDEQRDGGGDETDMCTSPGVVVETPCDVLGPGVDPDAGSTSPDDGRDNDDGTRARDAVFASMDDVDPGTVPQPNIGFMAIRYR